MTATGTAPLTYAWQRDGSTLAGATQSSYTTPATATADDGAQYRVVVTNSAGSATSAAAGLTVHPVQSTAWTTPILIQPDLTVPPYGSSPSQTRIAMDGAGNAIAVWDAMEPPGFGQTIHASRYTPGVGWSAQLRIDSGAKSDHLMEPQVALDPAGNGLAVWSQQKTEGAPTGYFIAMAVFDKALGWQPPAYLDTTADAQAYLSLAMIPDGHAFLAYRRLKAGVQSIYVSRFVPGTGWDPPQFLKNLNFSTGNAFPSGIPSVAAGAGGAAVVTWRDPDGIAYAARYANGWQPVEQLGLTFTVGSGNPTQLPSWDYSTCEAAVDAQGNMLVLWQTDDGREDDNPAAQHRQLMVSEHGPSGGWSPPFTLEAGLADSSNYSPRIGLDASGNATVTWIARHATTAQGWFSRKALGGAWQPPALVSTLELDSKFAFATSANGSATFVYSPDTNQLLAARTLVPGSGWGPEIQIDTTLGYSDVSNSLGFDYTRDFDVAMDAQGHATAAWTHVNAQAQAASTVWASTTP